MPSLTLAMHRIAQVTFRPPRSRWLG